MDISAREQKVLILAGLVGVVFVATQILPAVQGLYERRNAEIENVLLAVEREARLIEDSLPVSYTHLTLPTRAQG